MANSVTARFNDDCKVFVSMSDDTTVEKAVIIDAEGNETDIGGGGGESDFSTAIVKINNTSLNDCVIQIACIALDAITTYYSSPRSSSFDLEVILYKGSSGFDTPDGFTISEVTGDIEVDEGYVIISGDGTITIEIPPEP